MRCQSHHQEHRYHPSHLLGFLLLHPLYIECLALSDTPGHHTTLLSQSEQQRQRDQQRQSDQQRQRDQHGWRGQSLVPAPTVPEKRMWRILHSVVTGFKIIQQSKGSVTNDKRGSCPHSEGQCKQLGMLVECLPRIQEALSLVSSTRNNNNNNNCGGTVL